MEGDDGGKCDDDWAGDAMTAVEELIAAERERFLAGSGASIAWHERAARWLPAGVASSLQALPEFPVVVISEARGNQIRDIDGRSYLDLHNGFGANLVGHANPDVARALSEQATRGTLYSLPAAGLDRLAEVVCRRFGIDQVRFSNSGTEATMDALRLVRGFTGRDEIVKVEGCYHGHHDALLVGLLTVDGIHAESAGIPPAVAGLTHCIPFNDQAALASILEERGERIAAVILEPVMMNNAGLICPEPGYLEAVRELTASSGVLLIFDEVKTGMCGPGGATGHFGVRPDVLTWGKGLGCGVPIAGFGGSRAVMEPITTGEVAAFGTFNGNPLCVAAALAGLETVLTVEEHRRLDGLAAELADRLAAAGRGIAVQVPRFGPKGAIVFSSGRARDHREFMVKTDFSLTLAWWLFAANRGLLFAPGFDEQWTINAAFTAADIAYVAGVFAEFAEAATAADVVQQP